LILPGLTARKLKFIYSITLKKKKLKRKKLLEFDQHQDKII